MIRKILGITFLLLLLAAVAVGAYGYHIWQQLQQPVNLPEQGLTYSVKPGATLRTVGRQLHEQGIVVHPRYLEVWGRWIEPGGVIKVGEYRLEPELTLSSLVSKLRDGQAIQHKFTVVEGARFTDFVAEVKRLVSEGMVIKTIEDDGYEDAFRELSGQAHPEGWIFPDTYYYVRGDSDKELLNRAYQRMQEVLAAEWESRANDLPIKTPYEALVLASIVEKETGASEERPQIAGVFTERLRRDMRLQTDPTVIYGMGDRYKGNIRKSDLKRDTPYNTYTRKGLPPTPIALPGADAIRAATHPDETGALFFVAKGGGRHHFSTTYKEHRKAVIKYLLGGKAKRYKGDE